MPTSINRPSADLLDLPSALAPSALGNAAVAGSSNLPSASDHVHQIPALTGDITKNAGVADTVVSKIRGKIVTSEPPSKGNVLSWDGTQIVWSAPTVGGGTSGSAGGITFYLNYSVTADAPLTGLPAIVPNTVVYKELGRAYQTGAVSLTSGALGNTGQYINVCGFVTDILDPDTTVIPMGIWDFNLWASTNDTTGATNIRIAVYKFTSNGSAFLINRTNSVILSNVSTQVSLTVAIEQQSWSVTDRLAIVVQCSSTVLTATASIGFGGLTPSHCHTTIPNVGGTGLVRVVNGVIQSQGSTISNADIASDAAIVVSKLSGVVASSTLGVANGVAQLGSDGKLKSTQAPAFSTDQLSSITASSLGAIPTTDAVLTATAGKVVKLNSSGVISTDQLATIANLPSGSIGNGSTIPVITVDSKGRVTSLSSVESSGGGGVGGSSKDVVACLTSDLKSTPAFTITTITTVKGSKTVTCTAPNSAGVLAVGQSFNTVPTSIKTTVIESVESQTSFTVAKAATASGTYTMSAVYGSTLTTLQPSNPNQSIDGVTLASGDVFLLTAQTVQSQNGPWTYNGITNRLTRPSYWTGNLQFPIIFNVQGGTVSGLTQWTSNPSAIGAIRANLDGVVCTKPFSPSSNTVWEGEQTFIGTLTIPASSTDENKLRFSTGGVLSEVRVNNALDWDGNTLYITPDGAGSRKRVAYQEGKCTVIGSNPEIAGGGILCTPSAGEGGVINRVLNSSSLTTNFHLGDSISGAGVTVGTYVSKVVSGQYVDFSNPFPYTNQINFSIFNTINLDDSEIVYYTSTLGSDFDLHFGSWYTPSTPQSVNSSSDTWSVKNITVIMTNGSQIAYKINQLYIDGVSRQIYWAGGVANFGKLNSLDTYTFTIIKIGNGSYKVLGAWVSYTNY